jgi:ectoine hydroxylase-related dioxygenase (phytanoyl-CoA dioxygenase family)
MHHPDADIVRQLSEEGFAVVPRVIDGVTASVMRAALIQAIEKQDSDWGETPNYTDKNMVHNLMMHDSVFVRLLSNLVMHSYLSAALDQFCILYAYTSSSIPAKGTNFSSRVHVDSPRFIPGYTTNAGFIVALDDFSDENGATYFLPGSHLFDSVPTDDEFFAKAKRAYPRAGDGIIFNARTFHFGGANHTDRTRHAVTLNVCRSFMRQRFDYPRLMPQHMIDSMDDIGRRFIGYDVRVPVNLEQYYVPADQRLYKGGQG